jgi:hypothetical protein
MKYDPNFSGIEIFDEVGDLVFAEESMTYALATDSTDL